MRAIFKLIRLPNLIIIALTLYAFRYLVVKPYYGMSGTEFQMDSISYSLMVIVTMLIAVAGYVSNDYYDLEIDKVNRPDRPAVSGKIDHPTLPSIAGAFSLLAIVGMIVLSLRMQSFWPIPVLLLALITVWWYARYLKKSLFLGNLAVSFMSSLTLGMAWLFEWLMLNKADIHIYETKPLSRIAIGIVVFAFMLSLIREIIKDLEDMEGDRQNNCRSIPIVKGIAFTRNLIYSLTILLFILLVIGQLGLTTLYFPMVVLWLIPAVQLPLLFFTIKLRKAAGKESYHRLSTLIKWIMVGGIASMAIIWINFRM